MRLPRFRYLAPRSIAEATRVLAAQGPGARILAGGTDLLPNMKRGQQAPRVLVSLRHLQPLKRVDDGVRGGTGLRLGSGLTLAEVLALPGLRGRYPALWRAASQVASPQLRATGTLGGNLCLDTRCTFYDQSQQWRRSIDFCLKAQGSTCWVATAGRRCLAASSTDGAPALIALRARVRLAGVDGERELDLADLYRNDGKDHLTLRPAEILTEVELPDASGWNSTYWKLRRRASIDFPVLGVAAAVRTAADGTVEEARLVLGGVSSHPLLTAAGELLRGRRLTDDAIAEAGRAAASAAKPMPNTDLDPHWRKRVVPAFVGHALRELRGDDVGPARRRYGPGTPATDPG